MTDINTLVGEFLIDEDLNEDSPLFNCDDLSVISELEETKNIFVQIMNEYWENKINYEQAKEMIIALG